MKPKLSFLFLLSFVFYLGVAQIPEGFNYQAIARDGSGEVLAEKSMIVIIELRANSETGTLLWQESHSVISDQFGLVSMVVGDGTRTGGLPQFTDIDWSAQTVFLKTTVEYPIGTPHVMGSSQIWAVPYSLVAKDVEGPVQKLGISGTTTNDEEALFEVRNKDGQIVFAVYNEGIRAYVNELDEKGAKGGFAIGGFGTGKTDPQNFLFVSGDSVRVYIDNADNDPVIPKGPKGGFAIGGFGAVKGLNQKYLTVSNDSVRIYVDNLDGDKGVKGGFAIGGYGTAKGKPQDLLTVSNDKVRIYIDKAASDKGVKGGFAIGGYGTTKAPEEEYLRVTRDSTRVYVNENAKSTSGGFAIGGIGAVPGTITQFTSLTPENYLIGHKSGSKMTSLGLFNSFVGYEAGLNNTDGSNNVFLGFKAGSGNLTGSNNVTIGNLSGYLGTSGSSNVFLGDSAGYGNTNSFNVFLGKGSGKANEGQYNSFMGYQSGMNNTSGSSNVFLGYRTGFNNIGGADPAGSYNVFIGRESGYKNSTGAYNTFLGFQAGRTSNSSYNTFIGYKVGMSNTSGSHNAFIGYQAGTYYTTGSNNTFIGYQAGLGSSANFGTGSNNVALGYQAGINMTTGYNNVMIGSNTGLTVNEGFDNILIGSSAGANIKKGDSNIAIGLQTGQNLTDNQRNTLVGEKAGAGLAVGNENVFYGAYAGYLTNGPNENTFIGYDAGYSNVTGVGSTYVGWRTGRQTHGSYNVFIGRAAGMNEDGDYKLYIDQNSTPNPLIWGDFTDGSEKLAFNGKVGIYTKTPAVAMHIKSNAGMLILEGTDHAYLQYYPDGYAAGSKGYIGFPGASIDDIYVTNGITAGNIIINPGSSGYVGIGTTAPTQKLEVTGNAYVSGKFFVGGTFYTPAALNAEAWQAPVAMFNYRGDFGGKIIVFYRGNAGLPDPPEVGSISVSDAGAVSYNAFTGSHYGVAGDQIEEGKLVVMNGNNSRFGGNEGAEVLYGISESLKANDPAAMGAYLSLLESMKPLSNTNPYLIMAEGNGEMWIVDNGENLQPGDFLISSDVKGHAMKDKGEFSESYVIAKVAEPVDWQNISETVDGIKHYKVSVLFTSFVRNNYTVNQSEEVTELKERIKHLETLVQQLMEK